MSRKIFSKSHVFHARCENEYQKACDAFIKRARELGGTSLFTSGTMSDGAVMMEYKIGADNVIELEGSSHKVEDDVDLIARCYREHNRIDFDIRSREDNTAVDLLYGMLSSYFRRS